MRKLIMTMSAIALSTSMATLAHSDEIEEAVEVELVKKTYIHHKTYDVSVRGDRYDSRSDVYDEALKKAANKTLKKNYEWFRVIDRETDKEVIYSEREGRSSFGARYETTPVTNCGLLTCNTRYETQRTTDFEYRNRAPETRERRYKVTLEFEVGYGPAPDGDKVYDARDVKREMW